MRSDLHRSLEEYLVMRRALGHCLDRPEKLLVQFLTYLEEAGQDHITLENAQEWATLPEDCHRSWYSLRLSVVRGFAAHLKILDGKTEVPPADVLPWKRCRATPYLYSDDEMKALLAASKTLRTKHRAATFSTLIGLLFVSGIRIGEALALDRTDFDTANGTIVVRRGKFGKSRLLPLHHTTAVALNSYLQRTDRPCDEDPCKAIFVSTLGSRLRYRSAQDTFSILVRKAGLLPRSVTCRPRLHDFRHSFAIRTIIEAYRQGVDAQVRLLRLSTYLGHVNPARTYWYLSATPELLGMAGNRLEQYLRGQS